MLIILTSHTRSKLMLNYYTKRRYSGKPGDSFRQTENDMV